MTRAFSLLLAFCCSAMCWAAAPREIEAEAQASSATIYRGGDLLIVREPDDGRIAFSGDAALCFVPRGKGSALELSFDIEEAGIYRFRFYAAHGPSCGIYRVEQDEVVKGWYNLGGPQVMHSRQLPHSLTTKRLRLKAGENRLRFVSEGTNHRGGNLVLDSLLLIPDALPAPPPIDEWEVLPVAGEELGPELLHNGDFELFVPTDRFREPHQVLHRWCLNSVPSPDPLIVREASAARSGEQAIRLAPDALEDNTILYQAGVPVQSGSRYRVTLHVRGTGIFCAMWYQSKGAVAADSLHPSVCFPAGEEWQAYSYVFAPSVGGKVTQAAFALIADHGSEIWFDDLSIRQILNP